MEIKIDIIPKECVIEYPDYQKYKEIKAQRQEETKKLQEEVIKSLNLSIDDTPDIEDCICPICNMKIVMSDYLHTIFKEDKYSEWAANLVTHYRHDHIRYYDASWRNYHYADKNPEYKYAVSHEDYKEIVNNRAKRQLIRSITKNFKKDISIYLVYGFLNLQSNDEKTIKLIRKKINELQC